MTDIEISKTVLKNEGCSVVLCKNGTVIKKQSKGIAPLIEIIDEKTDTAGFAAADKIVGKAAAMLFSHMNVTSVYGDVMSRLGYEYLLSVNIAAQYGNVCENIINREGDGICPMEQTVCNIDDETKALDALRKKVSELRSKGKESAK